MGPELPPHLSARAKHWDKLSPWERAQLGRAIRQLGWSYGEIMTVVPVPKSTLANWCRNVMITPEQGNAILTRTGSRKGVPRDTQRMRRSEVEKIRSEATSYAITHLDDPQWIAGTVMYWAEGSKVGRQLGLANSDPRALRLFIEWTRRYHNPAADFVLKLNLHLDNDERAARRYWESATNLPGVAFHRTFIKPEGTGHRKNHLTHGVALIRMRRSTDAWIRTLAWIDVLAGEWTPGRLLSSPPGR